MPPQPNSNQVDATGARQPRINRAIAVLAVLAIVTAVLSLSAALYFRFTGGPAVTSVPSWWVLIAMTITIGAIGAVLTYSLRRALKAQAPANSK